MVPGRKALWIKGAGEQSVMDEAREAFHQIIKMAILFGGVAIFYILAKNKLLKKWKK
ncbi:hypothetical protein [Vreelandella venusta]|uniref:hypothetical protein n=1 Tax=Vreelandella venusta TaxID=44935 RepID=UPI00384F0BA7